MTADINYSKDGLQNQNVYSPNLTPTDKSSSKDFNTEQNDYEDALQTEPENAGEVTDTDNYRGENINNDLQYIEEQYVAEDEIRVPETHRGVATEQISLLKEYREHISNRGVGLSDVATLEQHHPGLITKGAPETYTYKPSEVNKQYALEAIDQLITRLSK